MIKKITIVFILALGFFFVGFGQVIHKPVDILQMFQASKMHYQVGELYIDVRDTAYPDRLTQTEIYREDSNDQTFIRKISLAKGAKSEWDAGQMAFNAENYKDAQKHYKNVLDIQPDYYPAKVQMGKSFVKEGDYEKAISSFKQAISKNYIDYMPHLLLAETYEENRDFEDAASEITIANILNRNDSNILGSVDEMYTEANLKYNDWDFTPQCKVFKSKADKDINVLSHKYWDGYAMAKALWEFEPGYAQSQGEKPGVPSLLEEKECLLNLLANQDQHIDAELPDGIDYLKLAQDNKLIDGFIYYEILLPPNPTLAYELPNNVIKKIKDYVILAHGGQAPKKKK